MTYLVYKRQPLRSLLLKDHSQYLGFTTKQRWTNQNCLQIPLNHPIDPERTQDYSPCLGSLLPAWGHTSMCQQSRWKPLDKILDPLPHGNVYGFSPESRISGWHDCRGILKFEEGDMTASLFRNLEIDFHLSDQNLTFINMLVLTWDCCNLN